MALDGQGPHPRFADGQNPNPGSSVDGVPVITAVSMARTRTRGPQADGARTRNRVDG